MASKRKKGITPAERFAVELIWKSKKNKGRTVTLDDDGGVTAVIFALRALATKVEKQPNGDTSYRGKGWHVVSYNSSPGFAK